MQFGSALDTCSLRKGVAALLAPGGLQPVVGEGLSSVGEGKARSRGVQVFGQTGRRPWVGREGGDGGGGCRWKDR